MILNNESDTIKFAKEYSNKIKSGDIICLVGDLGAGKTTFAKHFLYTLGVKDDIVSPTFNYVKEYNIENDNINKIYHFDVYRIKSNEQLQEIGFYDYIYDKNAISLIEWADNIIDEIPENAKWLKIRIIDENKREIIEE